MNCDSCDSVIGMIGPSIHPDEASGHSGRAGSFDDRASGERRGTRGERVVRPSWWPPLGRAFRRLMTGRYGILYRASTGRGEACSRTGRIVRELCKRGRNAQCRR